MLIIMLGHKYFKWTRIIVVSRLIKDNVGTYSLLIEAVDLQNSGTIVY